MQKFMPPDPYSYVPGKIKDDNPVIISSPCVRAGTTLVQRLLCSSGKILVYGEYCAVELHFQLNFYLSRMLFFGNRIAERDGLLSNVISGKVNNWISDLMPPISSYLSRMTDNYLGMFHYYREYAQQEGRFTWGTKVAGWNWQQLNLLGQLMQKSRFVYIYRDVAECLASAKAANMIFSRDDARQFCWNWVNNMESLWHQRDNPRVLLVNFHDLITHSREIIAKLESFCGTPGIDLQVLSHRVNTYNNQENTGEPAPYIPPTELTEGEKEMVKDITGELWGKMHKDKGND